MNSGKILLGILAGVAAGAAIGVLFAPDKGTKTRKSISKKSDGFIEELKDKFDGFLKTVSDKYDSTAESADELMDKGKTKINDFKKRSAI